MKNVIDIASFLSYRGVPFPLSPTDKYDNRDGKLISFDTANVAERAEYAGMYDIVGRPVFLPVFLNSLYLPNTVTVVTRENRIVSTPVVGRSGSVKELINSEDFRITVRGAVINYTSDNYPADIIEQIAAFANSRESLLITNSLINMLGIERVVVTGLNLPDSGKQNIALFELNLLSDFDYELIIE